MREAFCWTEIEENVERVCKCFKCFAIVPDWTAMNFLSAFKSLKASVQVDHSEKS